MWCVLLIFMVLVSIAGSVKIKYVLNELLEDPVLTRDLLTMNLEGRFSFRKKLPRATRFTISQAEKDRLITSFRMVLNEKRIQLVQAMSQEAKSLEKEGKDLKELEMIQLDERLRKAAYGAIEREEYEWKLMYQVIQTIIGSASPQITDINGIDRFLQSHEAQIIKHYEVYRSYCGEEMKILKRCLNASQYGGFVSRIKFWMLAVQMFGGSRDFQQIPEQFLEEFNLKSELRVFEWPVEFNFNQILEEADDDLMEARKRMLTGLEETWEAFREYKKANEDVVGVDQLEKEMVTRVSFVKNAILKEPVEFNGELKRERISFGDVLRRLRMFERLGKAALRMMDAGEKENMFVKLLSIAGQMFDMDKVVRFETKPLPAGFTIPGYGKERKDVEFRRNSSIRLPIAAKQSQEEQEQEQEQEEAEDQQTVEQVDITTSEFEAYGVNSDMFDHLL